MQKKFWLCAKEVADILEIDGSTLYRWRKKGHGPQAYEFDTNNIRYKSSDVDAWIESRKVSVAA